MNVTGESSLRWQREGFEAAMNVTGEKPLKRQREGFKPAVPVPGERSLRRQREGFEVAMDASSKRSLKRQREDFEAAMNVSSERPLKRQREGFDAKMVVIRYWSLRRQLKFLEFLRRQKGRMRMREEIVTLHLPTVSDNDRLKSEKLRLLRKRSLSLGPAGPVPLQADKLDTFLEKNIRALRIFHLDKVELYFVEDDEHGPFSTRNELESLNSIFSSIKSSISSAKSGPAVMSALQKLLDTTISKIKMLGDDHSDSMACSYVADDTIESLLAWGKEEGMRTKLEIARFEGGRRAVASEEIEIGDIALEIPESFIISEDIIEATISVLLKVDKSDVLEKVGNISSEEKYLLWIMKERHNSNSKFKPYFDSLPKEFKTGLSFGAEAQEALNGTQLDSFLVQDIEILEGRFCKLSPILESLGNIFPPENCKWHHYLWACELWYTNRSEVIFSDGKSRACLIPFAGFFNHSECPHILYSGRVDSDTKSLKFLASRPCKKGEQCYTSYGRLFVSPLITYSRFFEAGFSGSQLVSFYGFLPKGGNDHDVIVFGLECDCHGNNCLAKGDPYGSFHMVRGPHSENFTFPSRLLNRIRSVMKCSSIFNNETLHESTGEPYPSTKDVQRRLHKALTSKVFEMQLGEMEDSFPRPLEPSWDVKLALDYRALTKSILDFACWSSLDDDDPNK